MYIGIDFDNTIICYDKVFHKVAREQGLIPANLTASKDNVRDYLRKTGKEDAWTEMQGYVYGKRIMDADPFSDVIDFFRFSRNKDIPVCIVSHKTRHPYMGPEYDLHQATYRWLEHHGFFDSENIGLAREQVFFELTKKEKITRIKKLGCTHFIDDLPEFLSEPAFPGNVIRILFDPNRNHLNGHSLQRVSSWKKILEIFKS
ncbi:MAG: haloacid dehalogenase-like hydrolase [Desulfobacterales bacterium]|nr:haloacid dehalogenase-like hydrolase [Desulfobacterales bacterium]